MALTKWTPTTDLMMLRRMGKLQEELAELANVAARCIIQGIDEVDPGSGKVNRTRLENEIADVLAQCRCTIDALGLDDDHIAERTREKREQMAEWEAMFPPAGSEEKPVFVVDHVGSSYGDGMEHTTVIVGHSLDRRALARGAKLYELPPVQSPA
jgi:NTP pyrophosphatase (non-canonical NTP hydrolase)